MTHTNLTAYEGVESLERFSPATFREYCDDKLRSCDKYVAFLKSHFPRRPLQVLEIGSGSGKLLFRLEREGMLERGVGFEVSQSRCRFAKEFAKYCESERVDIVNEDFVEDQPYRDEFDVVIGIDVVANLICAISEVHTERLLAKIKSVLHEQGAGVLELMTCEREMGYVRQAADGVYRTWKRFDDSDPFRFGLDELWKDTNDNLVWDKQFIARDGGISGFRNVLKPFPQLHFRQAVEAQGLACEVLPSWTDNDDTVDQEYIALMRP